MTDGIVTNTIMPRLAVPDTLPGVVRIRYIFYKLAKNANYLNDILPLDILNLIKCNYVHKIVLFLFHHQGSFHRISSSRSRKCYVLVNSEKFKNSAPVDL